MAVLSTLGQAYLKLKEYDKALACLKRGQRLAPDDKKINLNMGMALAGLKRYPEAFDAFVKAGDEAQAYNNIGVHYYMDGRYEERGQVFSEGHGTETHFLRRGQNQSATGPGEAAGEWQRGDVAAWQPTGNSWVI